MYMRDTTKRLAALAAVVAVTVTAAFAVGGASLRLAVNSYDYEHYNKLTHSHAVTVCTDSAVSVSAHTIATAAGLWEVRLERSASASVAGATDYAATFTLVSGSEPSAAVAVSLLLPWWQRSGYLLMPAAAYAGNRFDFRRIAYSPKLADARDIGPDKPIVISDVPRLNVADGPSLIQERSGALAFPAVGLHCAGTNLLVITTQENALGDLGINFEELRSGGAELTLLSPLVRERYKYEIADNMVASPDRPASFKAGDAVTIHFTVVSQCSMPDAQCSLPAVQPSTLADLFTLVFTVRDALATAAARPRYPFSECYATIERKFNAQNYLPQWGYYSVGMRENFLQDWQIGWTGGMITTWPLLFSANDSTVSHVVSNFDWLFPAGLAPCGFFWDSGEHGDRWYGGDIRRAQTAHWHLIRKSGDALYYIVKQLALMQRRGIALKESWLGGVRGVADAFVRLYDSDGQFGQFVDSRTGRVVVGGSTSGAIVPAALVLAYRFFGCADYLRVAELSARQMFSRYTARGICCGGPGDAMQNPDSESWYAMLESLMLLYETTADPYWLDAATLTVHQFATWVMAYDYRFPADCLFGRLGMQTAGVVFANTQNKHGSPGICTHSGLALLRLYRATGDPALLRLLEQVSRAIPQYMSHADRPVGGMSPGWISERVSTTDWFEGIGEIPGGSTWAETSMLLTAVELPGIYIDTDRRRLAVFDHVDARLVGARRLRITNPTPYTARTTVVAESAADRRRPWDDSRRYGAAVVELKPSQTKTITY